MPREVLEKFFVEDLKFVEKGDDNSLLVGVKPALHLTIGIDCTKVMHLQEGNEFTTESLDSFHINLLRRSENTSLHHISCSTDV